MMLHKSIPFIILSQDKYSQIVVRNHYVGSPTSTKANLTYARKCKPYFTS